MDRANSVEFSRQSTFTPRNEDGSLRLVLESDFYKQDADLFKDIVGRLYGPDKKIDIKDASSDSSESLI